jgi:hypothetical protein
MLDIERAVRAQVGVQRVLGQRRPALEQASRTFEPAARFGLAAELPAVEGELERDPRRRRIVACLAREPVCALVRLERRRTVHLPASRGAEALERLDRLGGGQRGFEVCARLRPGCAVERVAPGSE